MCIILLVGDTIRSTVAICAYHDRDKSSLDIE
jgi:hypothetical protein